MPGSVGVFDLTTPGHLYAKLSRELGRMRATLTDVDHAFNFFVTAEHLPDWIHPGDDKDSKLARRAIRHGRALTRIVSHLATGAKHFDPRGEQHESVIGSGAVHSIMPVPEFVFMDRPVFVVDLAGREADNIGLQPWETRIEALRLAEQVYLFWGKRLGMEGQVTDVRPIL